MYDFIHLETYPLNVSAKKAPKTAQESGQSDSQQTVKDIVGEAIREPENCPHVESPQPPTFLVGNLRDFKNLPKTLQNRLETMKNEQGRAYRKDTHVLLSGVASYPRDGEHYEDWKRRTLGFLRAEYGDNLRHVIEHQDEEHPHLHFYVFSDTDLNAKKLHVGFIKEIHEEKEKGERLKPGERRKAFADGCRVYLDRYHEQVGQYFAMDRVGPKRRRLSRAEYNQEKAEKQRLAEGLRAVEQRAQNIDAEAKAKASEMVKQHIKKNYKKTKLKAPKIGFFKSLTMSAADIAKAMEPQLKAVDMAVAGAKLITDENEKLAEKNKEQRQEIQATKMQVARMETEHETALRNLKGKHARELQDAKRANHNPDKDVLAMLELTHPDLVRQVRQQLRAPQAQDLNTALKSREVETAKAKRRTVQDLNTTLKSGNDGGDNFGM